MKRRVSNWIARLVFILASLLPVECLAGNPALVKDIYPGFCNGDSPCSSSPWQFAVKNNVLYFAAKSEVDGSIRELLWRSDGSEASTGLLGGSSDPGTVETRQVVAAGDHVFFTSGWGAAREVYVSDGTPAGTGILKDINPNGACNAISMTAFNGQLFLSADDGTHGQELWKSNGTGIGTMMVEDIVPNSGYSTSSSSPELLTPCGDTLFFLANNPTPDGKVHAGGLFRTDGNTVHFIQDMSRYALEFWKPAAVCYNNQLILSTMDTINTRKLWKCDGALVTLVKDIYPGNDSNIKNFTVCNGKLFFSATNGTNGYELWMTDGTTTGTKMVKDSTPGSGGDWYMGFFACLDGILHYVYNGALWRSDGTEAGTHEVFATPGFDTSGPTFMKLKGKWYFRGKVGDSYGFYEFDNGNPRYLFNTNTSNSPGCYARYMEVVGNAILISGNFDNLYGSELWKYTPVSSSSKAPINQFINLLLLGQ